jgi:hypothetical protein
VPVIGLCCAALCVPLCIPLFMGRVFTYDDLAAFHLPVRHLYREALHAGDSILWSPALFSGTYLFGEGQAGMAHPFHWLLYRLLPLGVAFNLELASSYVVALAGMWVLLRQRFPAEAALFGAMVFTFGGFNLLHLSQMNAVAVVAHLPWVLAATHALLTSATGNARAAAFAGVALLLASQLLLGYPQYVWLTLFADGVFVLAFLRARAPISGLALLVAALVLGVCAGGVQLLPTLDVLRHSVRADTTIEFRMIYSLPPYHLAQLWSPYVFTSVGPDFGVYDGAFCTVALAWLAVRWPALKRHGRILALLAFAAVTVLFALGPHGGVYPWLARLPGLGSFRAPSRYILLTHLALAGIASVVFEDVADVARRGERIDVHRLWPLAVLLVLSLATNVIAPTLNGSPWAVAHDVSFSSAARAGVGSALVLATTLLLLFAGRGARWAVPLLVVLVALDLGSWGYRYAWRIAPPQRIDEIASAVALPDAARPGDYVAPPRGQGTMNTPVLRGFRLSAGYLGLNPRTTLDYDDTLAQRLAGVSWRFTDAGWMRVPDAMRRARLIADVRASDRIATDVRQIDIARTALVDRPVDGLSGAPGDVRLVVDRPGRIVVQATAPGRQLLVLTERFHEGWHATDGEREYPTLRVYGDYLGCVIEAGTPRVAFTFAPASVRSGLWLTIVGLALTAMSTWWLARRPTAP